MNPMKMMQQFQQKAAKLQADLAARSYEATAGGGAVTVVANGEGYPTSVKLDPEILKDGDVDMLQDLLLTAMREAIDKGKKDAGAEMGKLTAGLGLPPGLL